MKFLALVLSQITLASAIPVKIESGQSPVPSRAELLPLLQSAPDADSAADLLLAHYQKYGYPAVGVEVEDQNSTRHVVVEVSRFGNLALSGGPARTTAIATNHFRSLAGNFVNMNEVRGLLDSFQANPLHLAVPQLSPAPDGTSVDALFRLEQSQSSRFSLGYLDTGASPLPRERFWAQGDFSDLWSFNSLTTARLSVAPDPVDFHALQLGSRFFRQNGSEIALSLLYSGTRASTFDAYTWQIGGNWRSPKTTWHNWEARSSFGFSFRRSNNALEFGNATNRGLADVFQITLGASLERNWEHGLTQLSSNLVFSPFGNDDEHRSLRPGSSAQYGILRTSIRHRQDLPSGWDLVSSLIGQWTSDPVLQADQFALGGASGIRGLPEQFALGDQGYLGGLELRTPAWQLPKNWAVRPSLFLQAGETFDTVLDSSTSAATSGVGLQIGRGNDFRASLHAGWRLDEGGSEIHSRATWKF